MTIAKSPPRSNVSISIYVDDNTNDLHIHKRISKELYEESYKPHIQNQIDEMLRTIDAYKKVE